MAEGADGRRADADPRRDDSWHAAVHGARATGGEGRRTRAPTLRVRRHRPRDGDRAGVHGTSQASFIAAVLERDSDFAPPVGRDAGALVAPRAVGRPGARPAHCQVSREEPRRSMPVVGRATSCTQLDGGQRIAGGAAVSSGF